MKKQLSFILLAFISMFAIQVTAQQTIYEVGRTAGKSFETDVWDFKLICTDIFYTSIVDSANAEQFYLYWFNDLKLFTAVCVKEIPDMLKHTKIDITVDFTDLNGPDDSVYVYTSNDTVNWVLRDKWGESGTIVSGTASFTNTNHSFVKVELKATPKSGGSYYYFTDFIAKGDGKIPPTVGITTNSLEGVEVYSYDNKVSIKSIQLYDYSIHVLNLNGQVVYHEVTLGNRVFELDVPKGIYFVIINSEEGSLNKKITIE